MSDGSSWSQQPLPVLKPVEKGRWFNPDYLNEPLKFDIQTSEWTHICSARFGEGRLCDVERNVKWTGDSYRYDIFFKPAEADKSWSHGQFGLRWWNGGGEGWLVCKDESHKGESNLLIFIAHIAKETERWDACHFLWESLDRTRRASESSATKERDLLFLEGRLKKRKKNGRHFVEVIEPE